VLSYTKKAVAATAILAAATMIFVHLFSIVCMNSFESESDALATAGSTPTTAQPAATTDPSTTSAEQPPVPTVGNGTPDYSQVEVKTESELPQPDKPGGSATEPESGGGYSG